MAGASKGIEATKKSLSEELKKLEHELTVDLPKEIDRARQLGDLSENAEYHMALQRQQYVQARVKELRQRIAALATVNLSSIPKDRAAYGSLLKLLDVDKDEELEVRLVTHEETDIQKGLYSVQSPIGKALLGKQEGDEVAVETPAGKRNFEILSLKTLHDQQ
ncbi:MAG TPA: transcription elongation factor GreA [Acidobacteriota bacterium]|nr:transcription elongation factor GreA [Acidobacteriota bacterium]HNT17383.1 transcription elongation factor GreA [Acidobacteriota bacterium]HPA26308.1 transcription elongation factor GreA [Acidobacteriota bacterium]HQO19160.1 transcription elongation factor GreA [Acidobacteriota bacterium]HQQ46459.1 transcription elongation factor GreA [Acidobacteriota bacterium]